MGLQRDGLGEAVITIHEVPDSPPIVACAGKARYSRVSVVETVVRERSKIEGFPLYAYRCPRCGGMHLTKHPPAVFVARVMEHQRRNGWRAAR